MQCQNFQKWFLQFILNQPSRPQRNYIFLQSEHLISPWASHVIISALVSPQVEWNNDTCLRFYSSLSSMDLKWYSRAYYFLFFRGEDPKEQNLIQSFLQNVVRKGIVTLHWLLSITISSLDVGQNFMSFLLCPPKKLHYALCMKEWSNQEHRKEQMCPGM